MKDIIRLAIVGPPDSAAIACEVALERRDELVPAMLTYTDAAEVGEIMARRLHDFDMWLFSGVIPYRRAAALYPGKPLFYVPHAGSSLYRTLLEILHVKKITARSISFDTFSEQEILETFKDTELAPPRIYAKQYCGVVSAQEVTDWHYALWLDGRTDVAATCLSSAYENLRRLGVPAFRIWPTRCNIRVSLALAVKAYEARRYKGSQLAAQYIAIDDYGGIVRARSSYAARRLEARLYDILLGYAERLQGTASMGGDGRFTVYSSRGALIEFTDSFTMMPILDEITRTVSAKVSGGIGLGLTVHDAEENACAALELARKKGAGVWMAVTDRRTVVGPLSSRVLLRYAVRSSDLALRRLAGVLAVSVTTINKLLAALDKLDQADVAADDLALYLNVTTRSARRILANLADKGFARAAGEELVGKGRPRKLYRILIAELLPALE